MWPSTWTSIFCLVGDVRWPFKAGRDAGDAEDESGKDGAGLRKEAERHHSKSVGDRGAEEGENFCPNVGPIAQRERRAYWRRSLRRLRDGRTGREPDVGPHREGHFVAPLAHCLYAPQTQARHGGTGQPDRGRHRQRPQDTVTGAADCVHIDVWRQEEIHGARQL